MTIMDQWKRRYRLSLKFAALFNSKYAYDITHDAWEYYYVKTQTDLFRIPLKDEASYLYTIIKKAFFRWYYREKKGINTYSGLPYIYFSADELAGEGDVEEQVNNRLLLEGVRKRFLDRQVKNPVLAARIFDTLRMTNGDQTLTAKILDISKQRVNFYVKELKQLTL